DDEEIIILTDDQLATLPTKLAGRPLYTRSIVLVFTGIRRGELLALRWHRLDLDRKVASIQETLEQTKSHGIRFKKPKTKNSRREITLPDIVVDALREHRKAQLELRLKMGLGKLPDDALVFAQLDGSPQSPGALSAEWRDQADRIGLNDIPLHALRHTHAS